MLRIDEIFLDKVVTAENFYNWLQTIKEQGEIYAGITREDTTCPIANFLTNQVHPNLREGEFNEDIGNVSITTSYVVVLRPNGISKFAVITTPAWAFEFIQKFDALADDLEDDEIPVTVDECIEIMKGIM